MADRIHIFPVQYNQGSRGFRTSHCTDKSEMCWCKPELKQVCSESDQIGLCKPDCWRCGGTALVDPYDAEMNVMIVHKHAQRSDELTYFCADCGRAIIDYNTKGGAVCNSCHKLTREKL